MICDYCNRSLEADSQGRCVNCGAQHAVVALMQTQESTTEQMRLCHAMMVAGGKPGWHAYDPVSDSCAGVTVYYPLAVGLTGQEKDR